VKKFLFYSVLVIGWFALMIFPVIIYGFLQKTDFHPKQPIQFPHYIHVLKVGLQCTDCHKYPHVSIHSGLPKVEFCMSCHQAIATNSPQIIKLTQYYKAGQEVPWVRVYKLPDYVYYSHRVHLFAGLECQNCHGPVELMTTVQQVPTLGMGWCLDCHERRSAPMQCNTCHD
jgi:hypothetical protein